MGLVWGLCEPPALSLHAARYGATIVFPLTGELASSRCGAGLGLLLRLSVGFGSQPRSRRLWQGHSDGVLPVVNLYWADRESGSPSFFGGRVYGELTLLGDCPDFGWVSGWGDRASTA